MPTCDFDDNEYTPVRDGAERARIRLLMGLPDEWYVRRDQHGRARICSHDDDVELIVTGNYTDEQRQRVADEICDQLNKAEREFDE